MPRVMANPKHLAIRKQGVDVWNEWRGQTRIRPDLRDADLQRATFMGTALSGAFLDAITLKVVLLDENWAIKGAAWPSSSAPENAEQKPSAVECKRKACEYVGQRQGVRTQVSQSFSQLSSFPLTTRQMIIV